MGDGELQEGQNWEAIMYATANKVDNLIATVILTENKSMEQRRCLPMGNIAEKFKAFGWVVILLKRKRPQINNRNTKTSANQNRKRPTCSHNAYRNG